MTKRTSNSWNRRPTTSKILGDRAEQRALRYLGKHGMRLLDRNYRCRFGEVDLVMRDTECVVFVEVRSRSSSSFSSPALTVDGYKQARIMQTALSYLANRPAVADAPIRFDVIAIDGAERGPAGIQWIRDAFRP